MSNKISGSAAGLAGAVVSYVHSRGAVSPQNVVADGSGNHSSANNLPPGKYLVSASLDGYVFSRQEVLIDSANPQDQVVNLRSRKTTESNQVAGF